VGLRSPFLGRGLTGCAALVVGIALSTGCGKERPPPATDPTYTPGTTGSSGGVDAGKGPKLPGCGEQDNGAYCDCVDTPLFTEPPNMYFVLDHSGSMADDNKWDTVRVTVGRVLREIGPRANFGAAMFPNPAAGDTCAAGTEIMPIRAGDPPSGADGPTTQFLLSVTRPPPNGGTPTAGTLDALLPQIKSYKGKTFVILATDGGPNCNGLAACDAFGCMPNIENAPGCPAGGPPNCCEMTPRSCLDATPSIRAVKAYADAGIPVYVIGIPGSAPYAKLLDDLATAGGTAQATSPKYFAVSTASSNDLLATLKKVAAKIVATCDFKLTAPPQDPGLVNVYFDEQAVPQDGNWTITNDTVTLIGSACDRVKNGDVLDVRIITGCPTLIR
jgi:hypothetical protein